MSLTVDLNSDISLLPPSASFATQGFNTSVQSGLGQNLNLSTGEQKQVAVLTPSKIGGCMQAEANAIRSPAIVAACQKL